MRKSFLAALLLTGSLLQGQSVTNPALRPYSNTLHNIITAPSDIARATAVDDFLTIERHFNQFAQYATAANPATSNELPNLVQQKLANQVEQSRLDVQSDSGPGASGSASAVAKAGLSSILSAAVESGAITQAINGNTINITGNVDAVARFLAGGPPIPYCPAPLNNRFRGCGTPVLKDLGFSVSVDTDQNSTKTASTSPTDNPTGTPSTVSLLAGKNRFSGATLKYVFRNPRDVHSATFQQEWNAFYATNLQQFQTAGAQLLGVLAPVFGPLIRTHNAEYTIIQQNHRPLLIAAVTPAALEQESVSFLNDVLALGRTTTPNFDKQLRSVLAGYMLYLGNIDALLQNINEKAVFSAEYDFQRPQGQPDTSAFRIMSSFNPFGPNGTLSVNVAGTLYDSSSVTTQFGRWRDAQASVQLERRIAGDLANYPARFSLAAYFQYMLSPGLISLDSGNFAPGTNINLGQSAAIALAPAGPIWIGEAKLTLKLKSSGAEVPISITQSNRTDLIKSTVTRGHIGLTFDFGRLFGSN